MGTRDHPFEGREERWGRVGEVFEAALELEAPERAAYLDRACADDPEVRAEVASLLAAQPAAARQFGQLAGVVASALAELAPDELLRPGDVVGRYRIERPLGRGGMGAVYRATDEHLERPVALKLLRTGRATDDRARARLLREARAAAALDHPHICTIYAVEDAAERPYLVMACYEGETLRDRLRRGPLPLGDALSVAEQTADALAAAHAAGVVHRDLKPDNVFLVGGADGVDVRLLDFGIAQQARASALTQTGATPGTVGYMAPEQVRGEAVGPPADLWALGAVLYEMLTGARAFDGASEATTLYAVLEQEPPSLAGRPGIPTGVAALTAWLLDKEPACRPAAAARVVDALRALAAGHALPHPRPRRRRGWWAVGLGAGLLAAVAGALVWGAGEPPEPSAVAILPFTVRGESELGYLREGLVDLLATQLDGVVGFRAVDPNAVLSAAGGGALTPEDGQRLAARLRAGHFVLGRATDTGAGLRLHASLYHADGTEEARAEASAASADDLVPALDALARQLLAGRLGEAGEALSSLAAQTTSSSAALRAYLDGEQAMRAARFGEAQNAFERAVAADSGFALAWYRLARSTGWTGADSLNREATMTAVRLADILPARTREALVGYQAFRKGDPDQAERRYRAALALAPDDAETWQLLGELLYHYNPYRGRPAREARAPFETARRLVPTNRELLPHLIEFAARRGDLAAIDTLAARFLTRSAAPLDDVPFDALLAWESGGEADLAAVLREAPPAAAERTLLRAAPAAGDLRLTRVLAGRLATDADPHRKATGLLTLAHLDARAGRWGRADRWFAQARVLDPDRALAAHALAAAGPSPAPRATRHALHRDLTAWTPARDRDDGFLGAEPDAIRPFLLGLLDLRVGQTSAARGAANALDAQGRPLARSLGRTLRAAIALDRGDPAEALRHLDAGRLDAPFMQRQQSPFVGQTLARRLRADALTALDRGDEAALWYASLYDGDDGWGLALLPVRQERRPGA